MHRSTIVVALLGLAGVACAQPGCPDAGTVSRELRISQDAGGFSGSLELSNLFGASVAAIGDVDGDGVIDLAVGEREGDDAGTDSGALWILFLNTDGTVRAEQKISGAAGGFIGALQANDNFGASLAPLGDLDGDGVPDLAVGAYGDDDGGSARGSVWVLFLNADGTVKTHQKISSTEGGFAGTLDNGDRMGISLANVGDIDGDGVPDLATGAFLDDDGGADRGAAWILFLNTDGTVRDEQKISDTAGGFTGALDDADSFGWATGALGDADGDGTPDLAVGVPADDDGGDGRGALWLLLLNTDGTVKSHQKISSTQGGFGGTLDDRDAFGGSAASAGDLNADGIADLVVGAVGDDDGGLGRGALWVLFLNTDGTVQGQSKISQTSGGFGGALCNSGDFGQAIAPLGDLDGDGRPEIAASAYFASDGTFSYPGEVWILSLDDCTTAPTITQQPASIAVDAGDVAMFSVSAAGSGPLLYQWRRDGVDLADGGPISGSTTADLSITTSTSDTGTYDVVITNAHGMAISDTAILGVRATACPADFDGDGSLTLFDFLAFQNAFAAGCP